MDWQGKTVIVTGGAQGIGMAVTQIFARSGAHVAVADCDPEAGIEIQQAMRAEGCSVSAHVCDVSSDDDIRTVLGEVTAKHKGIDCLINDAGISWIGGLFDRSLTDWDRVYQCQPARTLSVCKARGAPHVERQCDHKHFLDSRSHV